MSPLVGKIYNDLNLRLSQYNQPEADIAQFIRSRRRGLLNLPINCEIERLRVAVVAIAPWRWVEQSCLSPAEERDTNCVDFRWRVKGTDFCSMMSLSLYTRAQRWLSLWLSLTAVPLLGAYACVAAQAKSYGEFVRFNGSHVRPVKYREI